MMIMVTQTSTIENIFQLLGLIIVFFLILVAAYFTSRLTGKSAVSNLKNRNIKVIETYRLGPNRFLQIIEVSGTYILIGVSKDNIEYLTELDAEQVITSEGNITPYAFKDILRSLKKDKEKDNNEG